MATGSVKLFAWIGDALENVTRVMVIDSTAGLMAMIQPILLGAVTLYIMWRGYLLLFSRGDDVAVDVVMHCVLVIFITSLALNTANYTEYVLNTIHGFETALASSLVPNGKDTSNVFSLLDTVLNNALTQITTCWSRFDFYRGGSWGWLVAVLAIFFSYVPLITVAAIIIIGAKFLLTTLVTVGPLFLTFAIFPATRRWFDNWLSKVFEQCLVMGLGLLITTFMMVIFNEYLKVNDVTSKDVNPLTTSLLLLPLSWILRYVITQIPNLAGSLAGGFASGVLTAKQISKSIKEDSNRAGEIMKPFANAGKIIGDNVKNRSPSNNSISAANPAQQIVKNAMNKQK